MTTLNVQFSDSTDAEIISYFGVAQDPDTWENIGTVESSDARWKTFYDAQAPWAQNFLPAPD